jgi:hypothetical protein
VWPSADPGSTETQALVVAPLAWLTDARAGAINALFLLRRIRMDSRRPGRFRRVEAEMHAK